MRGVHERVGLDDRVHEVQRERFVASTLAPVEAEFAGDRAADEVVQRPVDDVAERVLGMREARRRRRDAQVAQHREVEAAGERGPVDRRDRRHREPQHRVVVPVARRPQRPRERLVARAPRELREVEAGARTCRPRR